MPTSDDTETVMTSSSGSGGGGSSGSGGCCSTSTSTSSIAERAVTDSAGSSSSLEPTLSLLSLQNVLESLLQARGYSTATYSALETAYYNTPTNHQRASFSAHVLQLLFGQAEKNDNDNNHNNNNNHNNLHHQKKDDFYRVMEAGLSPNACDAQGVTLLHHACRRGDAASVQTLLDVGASVQVCDRHGRTPLHEACGPAATGPPCFAVMEKLLRADRQLLLVKDQTGALPLSYVTNEHHQAAWRTFLEDQQHILWPDLEGEPEPLGLAAHPANSCPLLSSKTQILTSELAALVAQNKIAPFEAQFLMYDGDDFDSADEDEHDDESDDDDDEYDQETETHYSYYSARATTTTISSSASVRTKDSARTSRSTRSARTFVIEESSETSDDNDDDDENGMSFAHLLAGFTPNVTTTTTTTAPLTPIPAPSSCTKLPSAVFSTPAMLPPISPM